MTVAEISIFIVSTLFQVSRRAKEYNKRDQKQKVGLSNVCINDVYLFIYDIFLQWYIYAYLTVLFRQSVSPVTYDFLL